MTENRWHDRASCKGLDYVFDYDDMERTDPATRKLLRKICSTCPVFEECLQDTIKYSDEYTFRAGMTPRERKVFFTKIGNKSWKAKQQAVIDKRNAIQPPHKPGGVMFSRGCRCSDCSLY